MSAMPGGGDHVPQPVYHWYPADDLGPVFRQWFSAKTTGDKLDLVFQNVVDNDGDVETVTHLGARDFIVFWSKQVKR